MDFNERTREGRRNRAADISVMDMAGYEAYELAVMVDGFPGVDVRRVRRYMA
jgi:hypothetical protein